jgi:O-antigen/teichoic acid export membrane protein
MLDINWYYIGVGKVYATVSKNLIIKIFSVVSIFIFVKDTEDLVIYAVILALASFASNLYLWFIIFREVKLVNVRLKNIFKHILPLCQLFIPFLALSIYRYMDTIMIGVLSTNEQVGFYNQTEKIVNLGYAVVTAVGTVMLPYSSKLFSIGENEKALENMQKTASLYAFLSCAIAFGLVSTAGFISNVYLGEKFAACTILLQVLPFTLIFMGFSNLIRNQYLIPNDLNYVYMTSIAIGFVINLVSNYFLIKSFGALGAIITTLVTEFSVMLIQNVYVRKSVPIGKLFAQYIPYVINGLLMVVGVSTASRFLGYSWFNLFLIIVMGGCIYIGLSVLYLLIFNRSLLSNILIKIESTIAKIKK